MSIQAVKCKGEIVSKWSRNELQEWLNRHTDAGHPADRVDCDHCQQMIAIYGPMPPVYLLEAYQKEIRLNRAKKQKQPIPEELRWEVWERDNFTCQMCSSRKFLSIDHIVPESKGGPATLQNLQTLCQSCNSIKGAK